jgi:hypothetical protein
MDKRLRLYFSLMKIFIEVPEVFLHLNFVDFWKYINGLVMIVEQQMQVSPLTGSVFVFLIKVGIKHALPCGTND